MNLFKQYGIKEVADVVFYTITVIGDEEFYTPVLYLDTLKISTLEKTAEKVDAKGGYGNKKLISWNFGKEITVNLEDALFSPASMSMIWGGLLQAQLSDYTSAIVKSNMTNKYGENHYSTKAYPSPALTDAEWEIVFTVAQEKFIPSGAESEDPDFNNRIYIFPPNASAAEISYVNENRVALMKSYFGRTITMRGQDDKIFSGGMNQDIISGIMEKLTSLDRIGHIETDIHDIEVIDRMEKCVVKDRNGFAISTAKQKENLFRYYADDRTSTYTIYYDAKTMLPLFRIKDGIIDEDNDEFKIKIGTVYYKWTRTVQYSGSLENTTLGRNLVIDADTFPDSYRIVGETYIRDQKTSKDHRMQFTIFKANVSTDTSISLEAEGDPTTFSMSLDVLVPQNDKMMELKEYDVEEDIKEGGFKIVPQKSKYTYTPTNLEFVTDIGTTNDEIY